MSLFEFLSTSFSVPVCLSVCPFLCLSSLIYLSVSAINTFNQLDQSDYCRFGTDDDTCSVEQYKMIKAQTFYTNI